MKICFIGDAAAIHTQRWVHWFAADHDVIVVSTGLDDGLPEYKVAALPTDARPGVRLLSSLRLVRHVLAEHQPDLLHCHYINEAGWLGAASRFHPFVLTAWGSDVYRAPAESRLARRLNPWTVRSADWVTCDSEDQGTILRSWGARAGRVSVVGWGVDRREFHPQIDPTYFRVRLGIPPDAPVLLSPRQWYANSNIPAVVAAHALLGPNVYLLLKRFPGFEPDRGEAVERAIAASVAQDRIRVLGEIDPVRLPELYAAGDVVVSVCETDGTPASVLEAMASGRPIVALQNPSVAEWVGEPGGVLVPRLDPELIAAAVNRYMNDPDARARAAAHNVAVISDRADREQEFGRVAEMYASLVGDPGRRSVVNHV